jgi:autotransporter-associated beta strand protein
MSKRLNLSSALEIFLIGISLCSVSEGLSQTTNYTWNNSTNLWTTTSAWSPSWANGGSGSTTGNTNVAVFAATGAGNNTVLLGDNRTVYGLIFTNGANAYTLGSVSTPKQLDIMSGVGLQNVSAQNQIFNLSVANNGTGFWTNGAGSTTTFNNGLQLTTATSAANRTLTLGGAGTWNVASAIANGGTATAGAVTITATGTTTLAGNNTYDGLTTMSAAGGTLTLSGDNSGAAGGVTLTAGTLNINNNNALGSGALSLAGAGATINNTSGAAVVNAGNQAWTWSDGLAFGSSTNTAANNLDLGTGVVTASSSRTIALAGTGTKLTIGAVNITSTSSGRTITANGAGNTLEMRGLTLSGNTTNAVTVTLAGTANLNVTGAIVDGQAFANGVSITSTGTTTFSGNNTYTGTTTISAGTTVLSGNNSSATGSLVLGGASGTLDKPVVKLNSVNAISSSSTISGSSSSDRVGTLDFNAGTAYTLNSYGGGTMNFTNSFGQASVVTFTNVANILTSSAGSNGGRSLQNNSADLDIVFNGSLDIGSSQTDTVNTIGGAGDFVVKGNIFSTTAGSVRGLNKTGAGLLEMQGANNNYNGDTTIYNGTLSVTAGATLSGTTVRVAPSTGNTGTLSVNGTVGAVVVSTRGALTGGGTVGAVTLQSGSSLKPGNSPGLLTAASATFQAGSTYVWEINDATGAAGTNWDVFSVTGALDMSALSSSSKMNLVLESLSIANFSATSSYNWVLVQAGSFIGTGLESGADVTSYFNIDTTGFYGGILPAEKFQVVASTDNNNLRTLNLMAIPEPSTSAMMMLGLGGLIAVRALRRKVLKPTFSVG